MKYTSYARRLSAALFPTALLLLAGVAAAEPKRPGSLFAADFKDGGRSWTLVSGNFLFVDGTCRGLAMEERVRLSRAVVGGPDWTDYRVSARLKLEQIANERADYGVIARYQDKDNYYMALYKCHAKRCTIEAKINGKLRTLAEAPLELDAMAWHNFDFAVSGSELTLVVDGKPVVKAADRGFAGGAAGLLAYYDEIRCDRFEVAGIASP